VGSSCVLTRLVGRPVVITRPDPPFLHLTRPSCVLIHPAPSLAALSLLGRGSIRQRMVGMMAALLSAVVFGTVKPYLHHENNVIAVMVMCQARKTLDSHQRPSIVSEWRVDCSCWGSAGKGFLSVLPQAVFFFPRLPSEVGSVGTARCSSPST
jgi:hypothetical protein